MQTEIINKEINMLCEYMEQPVGLDMETPGFCWNISDNKAVVKAYQIIVSEKNTGEIVWDSGCRKQENAYKSIYEGSTLKSGVTYRWTLILKIDKDGAISELRGTAMFTTGLMIPDKWTGQWIGGIKIDQNSYLYRKQWKCDGEVKHAAAFVASPCYYVLTVNGQKADDTVLNNVFADYEKSLYYRTYDITKLIKKENALGIMTGLGWHSLREAEDGIGWGDSLFALQIRIEYKDGSVEWIDSNLDGWKYTTDGPIRYNSIYNGETYDARKELPGWDSYGYDDSDFSCVVEREEPSGQLKSQILEPIKVVREMPIVKIYEVVDGSFTLDFGKNSAGWVRISMAAEAGTEIRIKPAEMINEDGSVNAVSLRNAHPVDTYIFKGDGVEEYEPRFTYHGFRYAQVWGLKEKPVDGQFIGRFVRTAVSRIGAFNCDNDIVNKFYDITLQTEECNIHGVPTDCPQRDERLGWLNDMTVRHEGAMYNYKHYQLYAKWLRDIRDAQGGKTGAITDTAPFMRYGFRPADPVSASFLLIPWNIYLQYGDDAVIRENYEANARWVDYLKRNSNGLIVNFSSMGDWASPVGGTDHNSTGGGAISIITPQLLMSTGYFYYDCTLMEKMAAVLGKNSDEKYYHDLAEQVKAAFNKKYFNEDKKYYAFNSQASNILPLYFGMVDEENVQAVLDNLCEDIMVTNDGHLTTGNLCTRYAIEVLFMYGKQDIAWHLLTQTSYPSWGFMIENGATTMWERWEKVEGNDFMAAMASLNHPMNGGAVVALHKYLAGIRVDEMKPGYENCVIRPIIPEKAMHAEGSVKTVRGMVSSHWYKKDGKTTLEVSIPSGCTGEIYVPGKDEAVCVGAGDHVFICK